MLSFQEGIKGDVFDQIRQRLKQNKGKARVRNADYLFYLLFDAIVDQYFNVLDFIREKVEDLEEKLLLRLLKTTS